MLSQFTADATGRVVITGPVEATATGNILEQAIALGYVSSLQEARSIIRKSFKPEVFKPVDMSKWDEAYQQMVLLMAV
jgi:sugar (pentulose or hexulose) kinase